MRSHSRTLIICSFLLLDVLVGSQGAAEENCAAAPEPAFKVCFKGYRQFVEYWRDRKQGLDLKLDQYIPGQPGDSSVCFLERTIEQQADVLRKRAQIADVSSVGLEDIIPLLADKWGERLQAEIQEGCPRPAGTRSENKTERSPRQDTRCDPAARIGSASRTGEIMVRLAYPTTWSCFVKALGEKLLVLKPGADTAPVIDALEYAGPFDKSGKESTIDQFKVILRPGHLKTGCDSPPMAGIAESLKGKAPLLGRVLNELGVVRIDPAEYATLRNGTTAGVIQSGDRYDQSLFGRGLDGTGQVLGVIDDFLDTGHCFLSDLKGELPGRYHRKLRGYRPDLSARPSLHGAFVAGILAGESNKDSAEPNNGQAPKAKISFDSFWDIAVQGSIRSLLYQTLQAEYDDGARIFSNSWGDNERGWYTNWAFDIDDFTRNNEEALVLFAVENDDHVGDLVMSPENAKNVLAVGASMQANLQEQVGRAAMGPTCDGRRKPEIFAPGCQIRSAVAGTACGVGQAPAGHQHGVAQDGGQGLPLYGSSCATSWACPAVAGAAALARQHLGSPSGALLKATLLNGTRDMTGEAGYPNEREGWGRLLLDDALYFGGEPRKSVTADVRKSYGFLPTDPPSMRKYRIKVTDPRQSFKATLVWTDPPPASTVRTVRNGSLLVNDLDLRVERLGCRASNCVYLGNDFTNGESTPHANLPSSLPAAVEHDPNNVEQVLINNPPPGEYCVSVVRKRIHVPPQGFALVVTGAVEQMGPSKECADI